MGSDESENLVEAVSERVREALLEAEKRGSEFVEEAERQAAEIVAEAEARAARISADAESKAERTVALAEQQARERVERARKALEDLGLALGAEKEAGAPHRIEPEPEDPIEPMLAEEEEAGVSEVVELAEAAALAEVEAADAEALAAEAEEVELDEADISAKADAGPTSADAEAAPLAGDAETDISSVPDARPATGTSTEDLIAQLKVGAAGATKDTGGDAAARLVAMNMALEGRSREEIDRHLADGYEVSDRAALLDAVFERVG